MEQLEARGLGRPKETVEYQHEEPEALHVLRELGPEKRIALLKERGIRLVDEAQNEETA